MLEELEKYVALINECKKAKIPLTNNPKLDKAIDVLLEHCQHLLNSPSLVKDKNHTWSNNKTAFLEGKTEGWNACNEANRIARVKALIGLEGILAGVYTLPRHSAKVLDVGLIEDMSKAIRTHFTSTGEGNNER